MSVFNIMLFVVVGFICVYVLVDRICKCIEHKHVAISFEKAMVEGKATIADNNYIDDNIL